MPIEFLRKPEKCGEREDVATSSPLVNFCVPIQCHIQALSNLRSRQIIHKDFYPQTLQTELKIITLSFCMPALVEIIRPFVKTIRPLSTAWRQDVLCEIRLQIWWQRSLYVTRGIHANGHFWFAFRLHRSPQLLWCVSGTPTMVEWANSRETAFAIGNLDALFRNGSRLFAIYYRLCIQEWVCWYGSRILVVYRLLIQKSTDIRHGQRKRTENAGYVPGRRGNATRNGKKTCHFYKNAQYYSGRASSPHKEIVRRTYEDVAYIFSWWKIPKNNSASQRIGEKTTYKGIGQFTTDSNRFWGESATIMLITGE